MVQAAVPAVLSVARHRSYGQIRVTDPVELPIVAPAGTRDADEVDWHPVIRSGFVVALAAAAISSASAAAPYPAAFDGQPIHAAMTGGDAQRLDLMPGDAVMLSPITVIAQGRLHYGLEVELDGSDAGLGRQLQLTVATEAGTPLYDGRLDGARLGFDRTGRPARPLDDSSERLTARLSMPLGVGNEVQGTRLTMTWTMTAVSAP
jgi:hypothetical protein